MIVFVFATLYVACSVLLFAVVRQDRRRGSAGAPSATEPGRTRAPTLVFRTHV